MDNINATIKRPGISLKSIAEELDTSTTNVIAALNFHNNSELALKIREKYLGQLQKEMSYIEQTEKFFAQVCSK